MFYVTDTEKRAITFIFFTEFILPERSRKNFVTWNEGIIASAGSLQGHLGQEAPRLAGPRQQKFPNLERSPADAALRGWGPRLLRASYAHLFYYSRFVKTPPVTHSFRLQVVDAMRYIEVCCKSLCARGYVPSFPHTYCIFVCRTFSKPAMPSDVGICVYYSVLPVFWTNFPLGIGLIYFPVVVRIVPNEHMLRYSVKQNKIQLHAPKAKISCSVFDVHDKHGIVDIRNKEAFM